MHRFITLSSGRYVRSLASSTQFSLFSFFLFFYIGIFHIMHSFLILVACHYSENREHLRKKKGADSSSNSIRLLMAKKVSIPTKGTETLKLSFYLKPLDILSKSFHIILYSVITPSIPQRTRPSHSPHLEPL